MRALVVVTEDCEDYMFPSSVGGYFQEIKRQALEYRSVDTWLRKYRHGISRRVARRRLQLFMNQATGVNIIVGAGGTQFDGWFSTDLHTLDITSPYEWRYFFEPDSIDRILAEHVLEHLTEAECWVVLKECDRYLKKGGLFRIAVPDGYRKDPEYVAEISPPKDGHKVIFTVDTLVPLLERAGYQATPLEYFDVDDRFHVHPWSAQDGFVMRSFRFDFQVRFRRDDMFYTSLIVDARKE